MSTSNATALLDEPDFDRGIDPDNIPILDLGPYFAGEKGALERLARNCAMSARRSGSTTLRIMGSKRH